MLTDEPDMRIFKFVRREPNEYPVITLDGKEVTPPWGDRAYYDYYDPNNSNKDHPMHSFNWDWTCCSALGIKSGVKNGKQAQGYFGGDRESIFIGHTETVSSALSRLATRRLVNV